MNKANNDVRRMLEEIRAMVWYVALVPTDPEPAQITPEQDAVVRRMMEGSAQE